MQANVRYKTIRSRFPRTLLTGTCIAAMALAIGLFEIETHPLKFGVGSAAAQGGPGGGGGGGGPGGGGPGGGGPGGPGNGSGPSSGMGGGPGPGMGNSPGRGMGPGPGPGMQQGNIPRSQMMPGQQTQMMSREQIRSVQHHLNRMGYRAGPVDGIMGPQTHRAISAYQSRMGMMPNGMLTPELANRIANSPVGGRAN